MPVAIEEKVKALSADLGSQSSLADLLGVDRSQVGRWIKGGGVDIDNADRVDALEHVMSGLLRLYEPEAAERWLVGLNPTLGGRPVDLIRTGRTRELLDAIAAERAGSFA